MLGDLDEFVVRAPLRVIQRRLPLPLDQIDVAIHEDRTRQRLRVVAAAQTQGIGP